MENATKALLIAGGLLLTMLVVSLLVLLKGNLNKIAIADENKKVAQQLSEFNKGYEAYNKKLLKGTDIITVVNKVVEDNKKYGYNINMQVTLNNSFNNGTVIITSRNKKPSSNVNFFSYGR